MNSFGRGAAVLTTLIAAAVVGGCGEEQSLSQEANSVSQIEGSVSYREKMLLPPGVQLEVQLQDISRADAGATALASVLSNPEGAPPYPFAISYDPASINPRMRYAVRATITRGDTLLFTTTDYIDPFADGPLEIMVQRVAEPVAAAASTLADVHWKLQTLGTQPALDGARGKPLDIQFNAESMQVSGFSGCNRFTGSYQRDAPRMDGSPLKIGPLASTRMACATGAEQEQDYLEALQATDNFRLEDGTLLLRAGNQTLATFTVR